MFRGCSSFLCGRPPHLFDVDSAREPGLFTHLLQLSAQALDAFNHPLLPAPNLNPANALFGVISGSTQSNYPRNLQLELKLIF